MRYTEILNKTARIHSAIYKALQNAKRQNIAKANPIYNDILKIREVQ